MDHKNEWHALDYSNMGTIHATEDEIRMALDREIFAALDPTIIKETDEELSDDYQISLSSLVTLASQYQHISAPNGRYDVFDDTYSYTGSIASGPYNTQHKEYQMNPNLIITGGGLSSGGTVTLSTTELSDSPNIASITKDWGLNKVEYHQSEKAPSPRDEPVPHMSELAAMLKVKPLKDPMTELAALGNDGHYYDLMEVMTAHTKLMLIMMERTTKKW
jgi:hypothetical protein